jgi:hypothetical protein
MYTLLPFFINVVYPIKIDIVLWEIMSLKGMSIVCTQTTAARTLQSGGTRAGNHCIIRRWPTAPPHPGLRPGLKKAEYMAQLKPIK